MRRRDFIILTGGMATAWPLAGHAQQAAMPVIGFLNGASAWEYSHLAAAFRLGLSESGYVESRNVLIEYRWAEGHYDRLPILAGDLIRRQVAVIVANSPAVVAAKALTTTIPIVFITTGDPVKLGFVASLNRPAGNLTGATNMGLEVLPRRLALLHEMIPAATVVALLVNPAGPTAKASSMQAQAAAEALGLKVDILHASNERDLDTVFETLVEHRIGGLVIGTDPFFSSRIRADRSAGAPPRATHNVPVSRVCRGRRPDELWWQCRGKLSSRRCLHRPYSQRREAGRSAGPAVH
jgi:putative ABC transport system substrate-binding protein